jgi:putative flavoprotein involved in K+ transport
LNQKPDKTGYLVKTDDVVFEADNVVVATGPFQKPKIPSWSANLPQDILQIHTSEYRNSQTLPDGAVLVVGSGQSGCQIAEELNEDGCKVYLSVGSAGRLPRRYRGKDVVWWADRLGMYDKTVDQLPSPKDRFAANPHLSGKAGGRTLNLHQFARNGVTLFGHLQQAQDTQVFFAPDLRETLAKADKVAADFKTAVDKYVQETGLDAPDEVSFAAPEPQDGHEVEQTTALNLASAGIKTVIWATGYRMDFRWIGVPVFDQDGYPIQRRGVTAYPGLYFLGLPWLHTLKSGLFFGVGEDAAHIAADLAARS